MPIPKDLDDGIFGAAVGMHRRDLLAAHTAAQTYLGRDTLAEKASEEFSRLPAQEQQYYKATGLGRFGVFHLMSQPEVELALKIVAKERDPNFRLGEDFKKSLGVAATVERITERFPAITPERIALVLG